MIFSSFCSSLFPSGGKRRRGAHQDMTMTLYIDNSYDVQLLKYIKQLDLLPRPQGVEIRTVLHFAEGNTFGFRRNKEALGFSRRLQGGLKPKFAKKIFI